MPGCIYVYVFPITEKKKSQLRFIPKNSLSKKGNKSLKTTKEIEAFTIKNNLATNLVFNSRVFKYLTRHLIVNMVGLGVHF